jgi:hypothetical protein
VNQGVGSKTSDNFLRKKRKAAFRQISREGSLDSLNFNVDTYQRNSSAQQRYKTTVNTLLQRLIKCDISGSNGGGMQTAVFLVVAPCRLPYSSP